MPDSRDEPYHLSDELWEQIQSLLPPEPSEHQGSRPRMDKREAMEAILNALGSGDDITEASPFSERFHLWCRTGVFDRMWQVGILTCDELKALVRFCW